ncbi:putative aryl-alcohol dehydrogenase [Phyllosticta citriasiana]|uniref:Aryl-alcohol dehydrogenase n=1 Tax=Phyllosticta citriasiana TaxID=595635 RepID=A0ABR1KRK9_9PEZI
MSIGDSDFDYIIVGGGTAGLVLAARLTEDAEKPKSVLIIEAGANRKGDEKVDTPGMMAILYEDPSYDWAFMTVPQAGLDNRSITCPRGRLLGGSSAINFSAILYPSKADFESWAALGNDGWDAKNMAPYLRKFHSFSPASEATKKQLLLDDYMDEKLQGTSGPLKVTIPDGYTPFNEAWVKGFKELGFHLPGDPIAGEKLGAFTNPVCIDPIKKTREYSASAYFTDDISSRASLKILTETLVEKIDAVANSDGSVIASGVQVKTKDGQRKTFRIRVGGEVILAAGSIQSPQLLELSGIGNPQVLNKHEIPVVLDLPGVGENLQDHVLSAISYEIADDQLSADCLRDPALFGAVLQQYKETRSGPFSGTLLSMSYLPTVDGNGAVPSPQISELFSTHLDNTPYPSFPAKDEQYSPLRSRVASPKESTVEYMFLPLQLNTNPGPTTMQQLLAPSTPGNYITIVAILNHPFSRGDVHITSADPTAAPRIDPRYLSHPLDLELLGRQTQFIERLVRTGPFSEVLKKGGRTLPPNAADVLDDLHAAKQLAKQRAWNCFHPSGTCAMMPRSLGGVVDGRLRVHGTKGLRVVDASIFPLETLGNIQATVYAVAEKAADMIKEDAR